MKTCSIIKLLRKMAAVSAVSLLSLSSLAFLPHEALASTNISLSPSTGSVGDTLTVSAVINTGGDTINGVEFYLNFTGPISFVSDSAGNIGCDPTTSLSSGQVYVGCFIPPGDDYNGTNGVVGSFTFRATSSGTAVLTITGLDVAGSTAGVATGGVYTVGVSGGTTLPSAAIGDHVAVIAGVGFFIIALLLAFPEIRNRYDNSRGWAVRIVRE